MTRIVQRSPGKQPAARFSRKDAGKDASQLWKTGVALILTAIVSLVLIKTTFGGIGHHGPHTNGGWLLLILAMICLPLGGLFGALGGAKRLGMRRRKTP